MGEERREGRRRRRRRSNVFFYFYTCFLLLFFGVLSCVLLWSTLISNFKIQIYTLNIIMDLLYFATKSLFL
jgi:cell division septal protein FtsQ